MSKILNFDNILNVRDFGGQSLASGCRISKAKLFRGAQLSAMSQDDRQKLIAHKISLLVDMRYRSERKRQKTSLGDGFDPKLLEILKEDDLISDEELAPHEKFVLHELVTPQDGVRYMKNAYSERPHNAAFISITARSLKAMAKRGDVLYVHCAAGKDRTGTFAAILLLLLGASLDDVMDDYMLTSKAIELDFILQMAAKKMEIRYGREFAPEALRPFFGVDPDFLNRSLNVIGDVYNYANNVLRLSGQNIADLHLHYTAS